MAKQVVPVIVFAPIILVWFGYGMTSKIITATLVCFFPVVVNAVHGLTSLPPEILDLARTLGSDKRRIFFKLRLPHSLPYIYTALKPAAALAMIGAVVGEFIGGNEGLGYLIVEALRFLNLPGMFAATIALILLGLALFVLVELVGMVSLKWYRKSLQVQS
jgi:NitT/TauT family transport system permease protein